MIQYNNESLTSVKAALQNLDAEMGGTEIYGPIKSAFDDVQVQAGFKKRIFLLTDGQVGNTSSIIHLIKNKCSKADDVKVFSFGMGEDCERTLITESAKNGKGQSYFVENDDETEIKEQVIDALKKASEPALINCHFDFGTVADSSMFNLSKSTKLNNLFKNELVQCFTVMSLDQFEYEMSCKFTCEYDPRTKNHVQEYFSKDAFRNFDDFGLEDDSLFKLAANHEINLNKDN